MSNISKLEIIDYIEKVRKEWKVPGVAVGVVKNGEIYINKNFGSSDKDNKIRLNENFLFGIGSITKSFTSTGIGILIDRKLIDLDDNLNYYLTNFKLNNCNNIKIRHILSHTSGICDDNILFANEISDRYKVFEILKNFSTKYEPGTFFNYSNIMYVIAGILIEKLTGTKWELFIKNNILKKLSMNNTYCSLGEIKEKDKLVNSYFLNRDNILKKNKIMKNNFEFMNPAGGMFSTITDMIKWILFNLYNKNNLVSDKTLNEIHNPQIIIKNKSIPKEFLFNMYSLGWYIQPYKGNIQIRHGGFVNSFGAEISLMPNKEIGVIVLYNRSHAPIGKIISLYIYDKLLESNIVNWNERFKKWYKEKEYKEKKELENINKKREKNTVYSKGISEYKGFYFSKKYGKIKIKTNKNNLIINIRENEYILKHFHYDVFEFFDKFDERYELKFYKNFYDEIVLLKIKMFNKNKDCLVFKKTLKEEINYD
jgi:CubicO group peptidase (beta-lactamase class C family)